MEKAQTFLMLPDYFRFLLTGAKVSEYTNATSTQLVNPDDKQWDRELIRRLGYPEQIFLPLKMPGTTVGNLMAQMIKSGELKNLAEARKCVFESFEIKRYAAE